MNLHELGQNLFSYKEPHRFSDTSYLLCVRDEEYFHSNVLLILHVNRNEVNEIDRYDMGDRIYATPNNREPEVRALSERFELQQLIKLSSGFIIPNDRYTEGSTYPKSITFHTNFNAFRDNEVLEIFEGTVDEHTGVFSNAERALYRLFTSCYLGTNNSFFVLIDQSHIQGPYKIKTTDSSGSFIVEKSLWNEFGVYQLTQDSYIEFEANNINRRIIIPTVHNLNLLEKQCFYTDNDIIIKFENELRRMPSLYNEAEVDKLQLLIKKLANTPIDENKVINERIYELLTRSDSQLKLNIDLTHIIPEIDTLKSDIQKLEETRFSISQDVTSVKQKVEYLNNVKNELEVEIRTYEEKKDTYKQNREEELQLDLKNLEEEVRKKSEEKENLTERIAKEFSLKKKEKESELDELEANIKYLEKKEDSLKMGIRTLQEEFTGHQKSSHEKLRELLIQNQHFNILSGREFTVDQTVESKEYQYNYPQLDEDPRMGYKKLKSHIIQVLEANNRHFESHFIDNLLISIHQNTLTLLAGLPGTGKTSLARLLMNSLAPTERIREIPIGRGWNSQKDFIGFSNPLSGQFYESQTNMYSLLNQLNKEWSSNTYMDAPLSYVLLDEANLSPLEHYWSIFYNLTDAVACKEKGLSINIEGSKSLVYPNNIRFIGTINYDRTTEELSPRVIDRANIIKMNHQKSIDVSDISLNHTSSLELSFRDCIRFFRLMDFNEGTNDLFVEPDFEEKFQKIKDKLKELFIFVSPRVELAIKRYCCVASQLMIEQNRPLDYCITQRLLPQINVQGVKARNKLNELRNILEENKYSISLSILDDILNKGEEGEIFQDSYNYFLTLSHV